MNTRYTPGFGGKHYSKNNFSKYEQSLMFLKKARSLRKYPNKKAESIIDNDYRMKMPKTKYDGKNS